MKLYIHLLEQGAQRSSDLFERAAAIHMGDRWGLRFTIDKGLHGKPYFRVLQKQDEELERGEHAPPHFSISHTKGLWCCAFNCQNVGLDVERADRKVDWKGVVRRYFTEDEQQYVRIHGEEGFFQLWTRKEAWLKHEGTGIAGGIKSVNLAEKGQLKKDVKGIFFCQIDVGDGLPFAVTVSACGRGVNSKPVDVIWF